MRQRLGWGAALGLLAVFLAAVTEGVAGAEDAAVKSASADEIHWTISGPTSVTFDWRGEATAVRWRAKEGAERSVAGRTPRPLPFSSPGPFWEATVHGLKPGGRYEYAIGDGGAWHGFHAPPLHGDSGFTVVAQGDIGATTIWPNVGRIQQMVADARADLVLVLGDLTYGDLRPGAVDQHFNDVMVWSQDAAYMPIWGNHEWENPAHDDLRNYKGRFALPHAQAANRAPAPGCCGEDWYWFDYGNTRFVAYPEPYHPSTWSDWLAAVEPIFAAAEHDPALRFLVTFGHHPAFSSGHHHGVTALQRAMATLAHRFPKYVLNLNGHSHAYERTAPQGGVVHVTAGVGGGSLDHAPTACFWKECTPPAWSVRRAIHHAVLRLRFAADTIEGAAICGPPSPGRTDLECREGEPFDTFVVAAGGRTKDN